jgi:hypothetical protein
MLVFANKSLLPNYHNVFSISLPVDMCELPFDYHFLIMASLVATCAELRTRCEGNRLGVACSSITMCLSPPYHLPIIASLIATRAGLRKRCEESHLGVAGGSPCDFLAVSLAFPYHGLAGCHKCRI